MGRYQCIIRTMDDLALLYENAENFAQAEVFHRLTLEVLRKVVGENSPELAENLQRLGSFYHGIADGPPQRALLAAQRQWIARERAAGRYPHPFYWAAFVANGVGTGVERN